METDNKDILSMLSADTATALELAKKYPYCIVADVAALPSESDAGKRKLLKSRIAAAIGDADTLVEICGEDDPELADFYGEKSHTQIGTDDAIDKFLEKFGSDTSQMPDPLQTAPAVDYTTLLQHEEEKENTTTADALPESRELSESFVQILIKNRNYTKALEILTELNLNNTEKSVYFADQIRFLRKLIYLENRRKPI